MHCPNCGQQQISQETKFCSRCGMPLGLVSEVVANGGYLPQLVELEKGKKSVFNRRNGIGLTLIWFLFFLFIVTPFWAIMDVEELAAVSAVTAIFGGLIWLVVSLMFLPRDRHASKVFQPQASDLRLSAAEQAALPPQHSVPVSSYGPPRMGTWRDTNDLEPTSVTESTTRLLNKDEI